MTGLWLIVLLRFFFFFCSVCGIMRELKFRELRLSPMSGLLNATLILWFLPSCISFCLLLVYLSHFWHVSKQMPPWFRLCSMNSVLSSRRCLAWFLRKMPLTMHNQLLACWMRNGCKIKKIGSNLVCLTMEQKRKIFLPLRRLPLNKRGSFDTNAKKYSSKYSLNWRKDAHFS